MYFFRFVATIAITQPKCHASALLMLQFLFAAISPHERASWHQASISLHEPTSSSYDITRSTGNAELMRL